MNVVMTKNGQKWMFKCCELRWRRITINFSQQ